jgi:hypothetical protein
MAAHSDSTQDAAPGTGMRGKTVLFTRAPRRMGCFAASEFTRPGQRSQSSGTTRRGARQRSRRSAGPAELLHADTGDAAQVYALAAAVLARSGPDKETSRYRAWWPGRSLRSWHAWRTGTPARLAAARMQATAAYMAYCQKSSVCQ